MNVNKVLIAIVGTLSVIALILAVYVYVLKPGPNEVPIEPEIQEEEEIPFTFSI